MDTSALGYLLRKRASAPAKPEPGSLAAAEEYRAKLSPELAAQDAARRAELEKARGEIKALYGKYTPEQLAEVRAQEKKVLRDARAARIAREARRPKVDYRLAIATRDPVIGPGVLAGLHVDDPLLWSTTNNNLVARVGQRW